jgi:hypothetical protein
MAHLASNEEIQSTLTMLVANLVSGANPAKVKSSPIAINHWSFVFRVDPQAGHATSGYYVKIPKDDVRSTNILPLTPGAVRLARDEYASLLHLETHWRAQDIDVSFVRPVAFFETHNAIVTEAVEADPFFAVLRRHDLRSLATGAAGRKEDAGHRSLGRLGTALARYHRQSGQHAAWSGRDLADRLESQRERLESLGWPRDCGQALTSAIDGLSRLSGEGEKTSTLKGLDVRNVLSGPDERLFLLDPGKIKTDFREADVARFIMTCRILYWGSPLFALGLRPHRSYEAAFLTGYYGDEGISALLAPMLLRETLKTWLMAYAALQRKPWAAPIKSLVKRHYIDRILGRWIIEDFSSLRAR